MFRTAKRLAFSGSRQFNTLLRKNMNILDYYQLTQKLTEMNMKKLSDITVNEYSKFFHPSLAQQLYIGSSVHNWFNICTQLAHMYPLAPSVQKKKEIEIKVD